MRRLLLLLLLGSIMPAWGQESSSQASPAPAESIAPPVADAETAMAKADWKTAEPLLQAWLANHPTDARALFDAGYAADAQGRDGDAATLYQRAVAADPASFDAQISLGLLLARTGKPAEAKPALEAATRLDPGTAGAATKAKAWRALATIAASANPTDTAQASIDLLEALKLSPKHPPTPAWQPGRSQRRHRWRRSGLPPPSQSRSESPDGAAGLAHLLIAQKKYADAEALLAPAVKKSPEDAALTAQLAAVLVAEDKDDALTLLQDFHTRHPKEGAITRMLAQVEADAGDSAESDALYISLLAAKPRDPELLAGHGQNLIRLKQYAEALRAFQAATAADPASGDAWNGLAFAAFQTHQPTVTLHALDARSKILPENATTLFLWATAYDTLHDKKQAVAYYHRFLTGSRDAPGSEWQARQRLALMEKTP